MFNKYLYSTYSKFKLIRCKTRCSFIIHLKLFINTVDTIILWTKNATCRIDNGYSGRNCTHKKVKSHLIFKNVFKLSLFYLIYFCLFLVSIHVRDLLFKHSLDLCLYHWIFDYLKFDIIQHYPDFCCIGCLLWRLTNSKRNTVYDLFIISSLLPFYMLACLEEDI